MKIKILLLSLVVVLLAAGKNTAQNLACNDMVFISLDENCSFTIVPENILEGTIFNDCIVELDKTAPFGNGPWVAPVLGPPDINQTYMVRVVHVPSGNSCWGNVKAEDKVPPALDCKGLSTIDVSSGMPVTVATTDLSLTVDEGCGSPTLQPATLQYDCTDFGVSTVQLTATDLSGNTSTCKHTVLVSNSTTCMPCVSFCPPSTQVSFGVGNIDLLTAYQNSDPTAFDVYGTALSDPACSAIDSFYDVSYTVGTAGQNWFSRKWFWIDGVGQVSYCEQAIVFPNTNTVTVQGNVYFDTNNNCTREGGEQGVKFYPLVLTKLPSGTTQTFYPAPDGSYNVDIDFTPQDVSAELHLVLPANVNPVCPTALSIPATYGSPVYNFDIGLQSQGNCPVMQLDLGTLFTRRCSSNYFTVSYCNVGLDTAYGAFVTVNLDSLITLQSADAPYTVSGPEQLYTFQLGNVPPFFCGSIVMKAYVSCNADLGQTLCNEANIYPDTPCSGPWEGALVSAEAACEGDSVSLVLRNDGPADMATPLGYIVVEDFIMYNNGTFQLNAGDSVTIKTAANGATWRIEAEQSAGYPGLVAAAIEGCGGLNTPGLINAYPPADNGMSYDQDCSEVVGSYDPNDKSAVPGGYSEQHIIRANQSIEYKIRFQNTGTDTAFRVVVLDTLSPLLDPGTLETGASSHPYRMEIFPGGILKFEFYPIALPDSNVNEFASHGFLKFKIAQQPDLPDGTVIENTAAIYFDQNDPVLTNTVFHTVGYPFENAPPLVYAAETQSPACNGSADGAIYVTVSGGEAPYVFQWNDPALQGDTLTGLSAGNYQLTLTDNLGSTLVQSFVLTAPDPIEITLNATPALGNDNNGTAAATVSGGTAPFSYLWSNAATTESISGLSAGTYTVTVTDANGCTQSNTVVVPQNVLALTATAVVQHPSCNGAADGTISISVNGGLLPYTFQWSDPALQGSNPTGLAAGSYQLTLTDTYFGELVLNFVLTEPTVIGILLNSTAAVGNDNNGTAIALVNGGTPPYAYLWNTGAITPEITGLSAGLYTVTVTDGHGCTQSSTVEVMQTVLPMTITGAIVNPSCHGAADGSITLVVTGGLSPYVYTWGNPASNLPAGNYQVTVTDSNGTQAVATFVLTDPPAIILNLSATPAIDNLNNGTASAAGTGGTGTLSYLWSNGATTETISGLAPGTYTVVVTDANGCTQTGSVEVQQFVATGETGALSGVKIWPNPAHDRIVLDLQGVLPELVRLDLLSADGRLLRQLGADDLQAQQVLLLDREPVGGFVLLVLHGRDGSVFTEKVVVR